MGNDDTNALSARSTRTVTRSGFLVGVLVATAVFGLGLTSDSSAWLRHWPESPPAATDLYWPAPTLTSPATIEVTNETAHLFLDPGRDYVIRLPSSPVTAEGGVWLVGGHNIVLRGGEIFDDTPIGTSEPPDHAYGLYLKDQTGTVHIEGVWIHGRGIGQALVIAEEAGTTVQLQRSRLEALHPVGHVHTDGIQSWSGPERLRLFDVTIVTAGVGLQTQPHQFEAVPIDGWAYRRVNIRQTTASAYALWRDAGSGGWWREIHRDLWVRHRGRLAWPDVGHWNPGGPGPVEGEKLKQGVPRGGDFVPVGVAGLTYTPPGAAPASLTRRPVR